MTRFFMYTTIVIALGATGTLAVSPNHAESNPAPEARLANDGAFRDGLYLGRLAAEAGQESRVAIGRWSRQQDRSQFAAGYRRAYGEAADPDTKRPRSTE